MSLSVMTITDAVQVDQFLKRYHGIEKPYLSGHYAPLNPISRSHPTTMVDDGTSYVVIRSREFPTADGFLQAQSIWDPVQGNLLLFRDHSDEDAPTSISTALPAGESIIGFLRGSYDPNDREDFAFMTSAHHLIVVNR